MARQQVGLASCTLGEVKNRSDLIIYWGANPMEAHMRHLSRYSAMAKGLFTPEGRKGRKVIAIDVRPTPTTKGVDVFYQVTPGSDLEILHLLRALIKGKKLEGLEDDSLVGGVSLARWRKLAQMMKSSHYGVILYGIGITQSFGKDLNTEELNTLVAEMNEFTRFYAIAMRGHGNVNGANQVSVWQTGYPIAVNFAHGYPRFSPGEFSAFDLIARKEIDAALIIATDPGAHFPKAALDYLKSIPVIVMEPYESLTTPWADVVLPVAPAGIGVEGTFYRMDNVPLRMKKLVDFPFPSDVEILKLLQQKVSTYEE